MASAWSTSTVTAVNYLSAAEDTIRFNNKQRKFSRIVVYYKNNENANWDLLFRHQIG